MGRGYPPDKYAVPFTDCLLAMHQDTAFIPQLNQVLQQSSIKGLEQSLLLYHCGNELENRNHMNIALKLYKGAIRTLLGEIKRTRRPKSATPTQGKA
jgi:hypothetical protein